VLAQAPEAAHGFGGSARVAPDGELLVRHESMLAGYWNEGALEAPPMTQAHWLRTGDRAEIDAQGGAHIAGRALEKALHGSIYIAASLVLSDGQDSRGCLLALEECSVLGYAQSHGIPFTDYANLVSRPEIQQLVGEQIAGINATLHEGAPIGRYRILPRLLHAEDEVMTPALRMRPLAAERHFERDIEALFSR
jgi:long-chain acyl-CoA synthetase